MLAKVIVRKSPARGFGEAVRYIARDNPDQSGALRPELGTINLDCPLDSPEDRALAVSILDATAAAARKKTQGAVVYHVTLSWQTGERPSPKQAEQACQTVMQALGYGDHQALWAIHRDTDHDHVHLLVNRVHLDGRTVKVPRKDWLLLDHAMRTIELAQGWNHSPGPFAVHQGQVLRLSRAERLGAEREQEVPKLSPGAAAAAHREGGAPSFQEWAAGSPAKALKAVIDTPGATWERVHQKAAQYGLTIQPKGSGLIVSTTLDDGRVLAAKASRLGRWASKAVMEQRLGPFVPPQGKIPAPGLTYPKALQADRVMQHGPQGRAEDYSEERWQRRQARAEARKALAARFKAEQAAARTERPAQRAALVQQHRTERAELAGQLRQERKALPEQARQQGQPLAVMQSLWALRAAQEREALQKRQAAERKALSAKVPKQEVWRKWLEREAGLGDEAAKAALRGIRYREQRQKNRQVDGIEGEELDPLRKLTLAGLDAQIDAKRQLVIYRGQDGREKFTDTGPRIVMHDRSADSLEAALRMAAQKYGGKVEITGSAEFRERAARQAVRLGIAVADADLQAVVKDEQARMQQARGHSAAPAVRTALPQRIYTVDTDYMAAAGALDRLPLEGWGALEAAGTGKALSAQDHAVLTQSRLLDEHGQLNPLGQRTFEHMQAKIREAQKPAEPAPPHPPAGLPPDAVEYPALDAAKPAPAQGGTGLPEKQALTSAQSGPEQAMERALERWLDGDHSSSPVKAFIAAHDRATRQGANGRAAIADVVDRIITRRGEGVEADLGGFMASINRQRQRMREMER